MKNKIMDWINLKERSPEENGDYEVLNNAPECNGGIGQCYFDKENGWDIPDMIKSFYRIRAWRPLIKAQN